MKKPAALPQTIDAALIELNRLISVGWEYPDAQHHAADKCGISHIELGIAYDKQFDKDNWA